MSTFAMLYTWALAGLLYSRFRHRSGAPLLIALLTGIGLWILLDNRMQGTLGFVESPGLQMLFLALETAGVALFLHGPQQNWDLLARDVSVRVATWALIAAPLLTGALFSILLVAVQIIPLWVIWSGLTAIQFFFYHRVIRLSWQWSIPSLTVPLVAGFLLTGGLELRVAAAILLILTMPRMLPTLQDALQAWIDRRFFRGKYMYLADIQKLGDDIYRFAHLPDLLRRLVDDLAERAKLSGVGVWFYDVAEGRYVLRRAFVQGGADQTDPWAWRRGRVPEDPLIRCLTQTRTLFSTRLGDPSNRNRARACTPVAVQTLRDMNLAAAFPVFAGEQMVGFIGFGVKVDGTPFHEADESTLTTLGLQAERAIGQTHMLYEQSLMLSKLTHDTLNFLHAQGIVLETLQKGYLGPMNDAQQKQIDVALNQKDLIQECLIDLRELERLVMLRMQGTWRMRLYDLDRIVAEAVDAFKPRATLQTVQLEREWKDIPRAIGDSRAVRRVVDNLILNALKFTPAGGTIRVRLEPEGANIRLTVSDNGAGIPEDELPRVFDPFFQGPSGQRIASGTGLGLSVVKEVTELHHGSVAVASTPGQGTIFTVVLPSMHRESEFSQTPA